MHPGNLRLRPRRSSVDCEEERAWVTFYRRVGHDVTIAREVLAQLDADPSMKRVHLALYLCCKESLRNHKARQARHQRIGQFVRWLCVGLLVVPIQALRRGLQHGGDMAVECLPETVKEPAVPRVHQLTQDAEFAQARSAFGSPDLLPSAAPVTPGAEAPSPRSPRSEATRTAA